MTAAGAAKAGFFGCFGVAAALVAVPVGLLILLAVIGGVSGASKGPSVLDGTAEPVAYQGFCAAAEPLALSLHGIKGAKLSSRAPTVSKAGTWPTVTCALDHRRGAITYGVEVRCETPNERQDPPCWKVGEVYQGGRALPLALD
jgi:hypothetical protein